MNLAPDDPVFLLCGVVWVVGGASVALAQLVFQYLATPPPRTNQVARADSVVMLLIDKAKKTLAVTKTPVWDAPPVQVGDIEALTGGELVSRVRKTWESAEFCTVLPVAQGGRAKDLGNARFSADKGPNEAFVWVFCAFVDEKETGVSWISWDDAVCAAYSDRLTPRLAAPLRMLGRASFGHDFGDVLSVLCKKRVDLVPSPCDLSVRNASDVVLLDSCMYTFDRPGKGVRSLLVRALSSQFGVPDETQDHLCDFIEQFHQISLMVDDIQDASDLRRGQLCAYKQFGTAETVGAAYLQLFRCLADIPEKFPVRTAATTELVLDGCRVCLRGQALDVTWRERHYCPTRAEWIDMARGKTAAPFELLARLAFVQCNGWTRMWLFAHQMGAWLGACTNVEQAIIALCGDIGVFFQMRDDYINVADPEYWASHGFCDDLHEKKFSYPVVVMVEAKLPGFQALLDLYATSGDRLTEAEIHQALALLKDSGALAAVHDSLVATQRALLTKASVLCGRPVTKIVEMLNI